MSTRGALAFVIDGETKVTYNHFDSYPGGLGEDVLAWLKSDSFDLETAREQARALRLVHDDESPTPADLAHLRGVEVRLGVSLGRHNVSTGADWYSWLREAQGNPKLILAAGLTVDASEFPLDSLWCEWAYVIDLDDEKYEVYEGFQQSDDTKGRWAGQRESDSKYSPVTLIAEFPFSELPEHLGNLELQDSDEE